MCQYTFQFRQICVVTTHNNLTIKHIFFYHVNHYPHGTSIFVTNTNSQPCYHCLYVLIMSSTHFRVNLHSIVAWMSRNFLLETGTISEARPLWPNGWVFLYELSGCGFESRCSLPVYHHHKRINFISKDIPSFGI